MSWPVNARTSAMMDEAQTLYGSTITATQGSPSMSVGASGTTHAGQGVIDVVGADLDAIVIAMRQVGFAAWHRTPAQGFIHHVHGVAVGEPLLSATAAQQVQAYFAGRNGLADNGVDDGSRDYVGVTWETYVGGTYVPPTGGDPVRIWNQYPGDRCGSYLYAPDGILAGSPTVAFDPGYTTFDRDNIATPAQTVTLTAGDTVMLAALEDFDYGEPVDLTAGYWLIRWTGGGTLAVADAYDENYDYPAITPTWVDRAKAGDDSEGLAYFPLDPAMLDGDHLYNVGQPLIRVTCTSGTAVIDFLGLQVQGASGFWVPDGEEEWSPNVAPQTQERPLAGFDDGTFDITVGGSGPLDDTWTVDGTPVYKFDPLPGGDLDTNGKQRGDGFSEVDVDDALAQRDADIHAERGGSPGTAVWQLIYDDGLGLFPAPENWTSISDEVPFFWTSPTKSVLPATPPGIPTVDYLTTGSYDWFDADTGFLGWVLGPADDPDPMGKYVQVSGDAQTVTLHAQTFSEFVNPDTLDLHTGSVVGSWEKTGDDDLNVGGSYDGLQGTFPATEIVTSENLLIVSLDSTIRTLNEFRHTYPSGGGIGTIEGFTGSSVALVNIPAAAKFRIPGYRYEQPSFVQAPTFVPTITDPEDVPYVWLRNRQRNDGLGPWSVPRAKGISSQQRSIHNRGYR